MFIHHLNKEDFTVPTNAGIRLHKKQPTVTTYTKKAVKLGWNKNVCATGAFTSTRVLLSSVFLGIFVLFSCVLPLNLTMPKETHVAAVAQWSSEMVTWSSVVATTHVHCFPENQLVPPLQ